MRAATEATRSAVRGREWQRTSKTKTQDTPRTRRASSACSARAPLQLAASCLWGLAMSLAAKHGLRAKRAQSDSSQACAVRAQLLWLHKSSQGYVSGRMAINNRMSPPSHSACVAHHRRLDHRRRSTAACSFPTLAGGVPRLESPLFSCRPHPLHLDRQIRCSFESRTVSRLAADQPWRAHATPANTCAFLRPARHNALLPDVCWNYQFQPVRSDKRLFPPA